MANVSRRFFITGLPRSRTAWLAVLCSGDTTICLHDPIGQMSALEDLDILWQPGSYQYKGIADPGLGFFASKILERYAPRTLVIERPIKDVENAIAAMGLPRTNYCDLLGAELAKVRNHPLVMRVPFASLDSKRVVSKIFWHLMPGMTFHEERYDLLAKMRIETSLPQALKRGFERAPQIQAMMAPWMNRLRIKQPDVVLQ